MKKDNFGDRMKMYEENETSRKLILTLPICIRLDGKAFHSWTKGLKRPYDESFRDCMVETTKFLIEETNAIIGYTQSDEISLIIYQPNIQSEVYFEGKIYKLTSVIASLCTAKFNQLVSKNISQDKPLAFFDCRIWQVPNIVEATNVLLWREMDATRNSISMASSCYYSHKELQNKNTSDMNEMLYQKGINWNDYPAFFKRGTYITKRKVLRTLTDEERMKIPEKYRPDSDVKVERSTISILDIPPLQRIKNRVDVIFNNAEPINE